MISVFTSFIFLHLGATNYIIIIVIIVIITAFTVTVPPTTAL